MEEIVAGMIHESLAACTSLRRSMALRMDESGALHARAIKPYAQRTGFVRFGFRKNIQTIIERKFTMLNWAITFLVIALIAALLGFGGIAGTAVGIAKILFFVFLVLFVIALLMGRKKV